MSVFSRSRPSVVADGRAGPRTLVWITLLFLARVSAAFSAPSGAPLDLMEAVRLAEREAPMITARQAAADAAQHQVAPAGERPDPELVIGIENLPVTTGDAFHWNRDFMTMRKIGVMQALPRREKRELRTQRAEAEVARERALLVAEQLSTREVVAIAWIALAHAEQRLALVTAMQPRAEAFTAAATAAISAGRGSATDAVAAEQARIALDDRIDALRLERDLARAALAQWLPNDADRPLGAAPDWHEPGLDIEARTTRIAHHRELLAYDAITRAATLDIALAREEKRPDWTVELAFADRGPMYSDMVSLAFRVDLPLFAARRQDPAIAARETMLLQVESERAAAVRMHTSELQRTHATWQASLQRAQRYEQDLLPLGNDRVDAALGAYRGGSGSLQGVLSAFDAAVEQRLAYIDVLNALGQSWAALRFAFPEER